MAPFLLLFLLFAASSSSALSEADALLKFRDSFSHAGVLSAWNNSAPPCAGDLANWIGVFCDEGSVWGLQLHGLGLAGEIDVDALSQLPNLRTMSLMDNGFQGPLPNLTLLPMMKTLYLSNNKFSGEISSTTFVGMLGLKKLHLANNHFSGRIPKSLAALPKLVELMLQNNQFDGEIPLFPDDRMKDFNVSNNLLNGQIPRSLRNKNLCGAPLESCASPERLSLGAMILVALLVPAALAALVAVFIILRRRKQPPVVVTPKNAADLDRIEQGKLAASSVSSAEEPTHSRKKSETNGKITFLRDDRQVFDMTDLLKASAELLGSGVIGSTYKAALGNGQVMVVKRFKHMNNVNKEEFHEHMARLGRLNHRNVLPVVGFYYRKEEKLLVTDYVERASLASHLHGNRSRNRECPDWPTRLNILKGVAKGLLYLYKELPSLTAPHGHLKSSNVLLDASWAPLLTDYGLVPVVNQEHAQQHMVCYKCPEYKRSGRITKKTDVWSLGILIVETLTGRFPSSFLQQGKGGELDITSWVESVVQDEESDVDVFDKDMVRSKNAEGEMMKLLKIGLQCCQLELDIKEALQMIEEVKENE
ncbi:hypothetical protein ACS0TY_024508 [Phlomoides rotata]